MSHIQFEKWLHYIEGEIDDQEKQYYEDHLYDCDHCLGLYLKAVEVAELNTLGMIENLVSTDEIMNKVHRQTVLKKPVVMKKLRYYQTAAFHYIIAASMTIMLMFSGVFSDLMNVVGDFESNNKNESSIVSGLMDKSVSIIEKITSESKEVE